MKNKLLGVLVLITTVILMGCSAGSDDTGSGAGDGTGGGTDGGNGGTTITHTDKIAAESTNDPNNYGYDIFFKLKWDERGELSYNENSYIILSDGENEKTVGVHRSSGYGDQAIQCNGIGGTGNDSSAWLTDDLVSYYCTGYGSDAMVIEFEKGKQYTFFLRYKKDGVITSESEVQIVMEYGDKALSIQ